MSSILSNAPAQLRVSASAMAENYRRLKAMTKAEVAGVIKADGYGTGAAHAFKTLHAEGCRRFFVATPGEAAQIRGLDDGVTIYVLGGLYHGAEAFYTAHALTPVLNSLEEIARWAKAADKAGQPLPAAIQFDTGMNRLGLGSQETKRLMETPDLLTGIEAGLIMTHFACSDEKGHDMTARQAMMFTQIATAFPKAGKSLCNSSGIFRNPDWHHDLLRPGVALYGANPTPETANPMRSVVSLDVRVLQTRNVKKGDTAGYNATHVFEKDTTLATVAIGYADGFLRAGSGRAKLYWNGQPCPIAGRVSMDLVIVDTGNVKGVKPQAGDTIEVLGPHQGVDDLAADCGTIAYEILTSLGSRYERVYE